MRKNNFCERVYFLLNKIPKGRVVTYKQIAEKLKSKGYRAVGNCLTKNRNLIKIPCHRVVRSNGEVGGYVLGSLKKEQILRKEGIEIIKGKIDLEKFSYNFSSLPNTTTIALI